MMLADASVDSRWLLLAVNLLTQPNGQTATNG